MVLFLDQAFDIRFGTCPVTKRTADAGLSNACHCKDVGSFTIDDVKFPVFQQHQSASHDLLITWYRLRRKINFSLAAMARKRPRCFKLELRWGRRRKS